MRALVTADRTVNASLYYSTTELIVCKPKWPILPIWGRFTTVSDEGENEVVTMVDDFIIKILVIRTFDTLFALK